MNGGKILHLENIFITIVLECCFFVMFSLMWFFLKKNAYITIDKLNAIFELTFMHHKYKLRRRHPPMVNKPSKWKKGSLPNDIIGMFYILFPEGMWASALLLCQHTRVAAVRAAFVHVYDQLVSVRAAGPVNVLVWRSQIPQDALCCPDCPSPTAGKFQQSITFSRRL